MAPAGSGDRLPAEAQEWKKPGGWRGPPGKGQMNSRHVFLRCPGEGALSLSVWYRCFGESDGIYGLLETRICTDEGGFAHNFRDV